MLEAARHDAIGRFMTRVSTERKWVSGRWAIAVVCLAAALSSSVARAETASPFQPATPPKAKVLRLLAPTEAIDADALADFERYSGWAVAYDAYDPASEPIAGRWKEGPYDLVVLSGPDLQRRIAAGALAKIDRSKTPNARATQLLVAAKLAAYDSSGAFGVAYGWSAFGLLYDSDKAAKRFGGAPLSWGQLLLPKDFARMSDCGVALPNARDAIFSAAWRLMNIDPARATPNDVKTAGALLEKARASMAGFAISDMVGAMTRGAVCLTAGQESEADAVAQRARAGGAKSSIRFAYAREGGLATLEAFALPKDSPHAEAALDLLDFLLRPDNLARGVKLAGLTSARDAPAAEALKRLTPEPAFDDRMNAALEAEWKRLRSGK